jgi:membrane protease YdiL (CAAX protease family)
MSDQDPIKPDEAKPKKYPFWPDSLNARFETGELQQANKFAWFRRALIAVGKLGGQIFIFIMITFIFPLYILLGAGIGSSDQLKLAVEEILKLISFTISVFLAVKIFEGIEISDLGLKLNRRAIQEFLIGLFMSFFFLALEFLVNWGSGSIEIHGVAWQSMSLLAVFWNLIATFAIFAFVGWSEELLSRGYHLRILSKGFNKVIGVILSSMIFAMLHIDNPGATLPYLIFVFFFGILMSYAFFRTGQLWLSIGLHTGWDFFGGIIFWGLPINSLKIFNLINITYKSSPTGYLFDIFGLAIMAVFIDRYWLHKKSESLDW